MSDETVRIAAKHLAELSTLRAENAKLKAEVKQWEQMRDQDHEMGQHWTPERGCGDNSCLFRTKREGMGTNGGCRCHENPQVARKVFRLLRAQLAQVQEKLDAETKRWLATVDKFAQVQAELEEHRKGWKALATIEQTLHDDAQARVDEAVRAERERVGGELKRLLKAGPQHDAHDKGWGAGFTKGWESALLEALENAEGNERARGSKEGA